MKRLVMIGKWFKHRKTTVVDLQAYREMRQRQKAKASNRKSSKETAGRKVPLDI